MKFCFALLSARFSELKKVRCKILPRLLHDSSVIVPLMLFADGAINVILKRCCIKSRQILYFDDLDEPQNRLYSLAKFYSYGKRRGLNLTASFKISSQLSLF
ncbi:hypothetical protein [uncultured Campylobacter sp.]|uniref:hypothetical protein n=1 Tax=uncultured Campylobacter sp. TaxID=218934 RepID=UPI002620240A|nr:hypothetical protein [uncultured Campylobacter sp.]